MNITSRLPKRASILIGAACLTMVAAAPLISDAQEASPGASPATQNEQVVEGQKIFENVCIACHQPGGVGVAGIFPPLDKNPLLTADDPTYFITTVLNGRGGMPTFRGSYDDEQVAAVVTYVRQAWDNDAPPVTAEEVAKIREETAAPPASPYATPEGQIPRGIIPSTPANIATPEVATPAP